MYKKKCQNYSDFLNINIEHYKQMFRQIIVEEYWDEYGYSLGG